MPRKNELTAADVDALEKLATVLRDRRENARLSRGMLASRAGLCPQTIEFVELRKQRPARITCLKLFWSGGLDIAWPYFEHFAGKLVSQDDLKRGIKPPLLVSEPLESLGRVIRDRRDLARLSRLALSERTGLSDATIKHIESGTHPPSRKTCLKLYVSSGLQFEWRHFEPFAGSPPSVPQPEDVSGFAALVPASHRGPAPRADLRSESEDAGHGEETQILIRTAEVEVALRLGNARATQ